MNKNNNNIVKYINMTYGMSHVRSVIKIVDSELFDTIGESWFKSSDIKNNSRITNKFLGVSTDSSIVVHVNSNYNRICNLVRIKINSRNKK